MKSTDVWDGLQGAIEEATATCNERIQELKQKDAQAKAARMGLSAARGGGRAAQAAGRGSARGNSAGRGRGRTPMHQGGPLISLAGNLQGENSIGWPQSLSGYMPEFPSRATPDAETFAADLRAAEAQRAADLNKAARDAALKQHEAMVAVMRPSLEKDKLTQLIPEVTDEDDASAIGAKLLQLNRLMINAQVDPVPFARSLWHAVYPGASIHTTRSGRRRRRRRTLQCVPKSPRLYARSSPSLATCLQRGRSIICSPPKRMIAFESLRNCKNSMGLSRKLRCARPALIHSVLSHLPWWMCAVGVRSGFEAGRGIACCRHDGKARGCNFERWHHLEYEQRPHFGMQNGESNPKLGDVRHLGTGREQG